MYTAFTVDSATELRLLDHVIAASPSRYMTSDVDLLESRFPAQSALEYPISSSFPVAQYFRARSTVPFSYRKTHLAAVRCSCVGLLQNLANTPTI